MLQSVRPFGSIVCLAALPFLTAPASAQLDVTRVAQYPLLWPEKIATTTPLSDGVSETPVGTEMRLHAVQGNDVVVADPRGGLLGLPGAWTDIQSRAEAISESLPEDLRQLTFAQLLTRGDLLPERLAMIEDIELTIGGTLKTGMLLAPGKIHSIDGQHLIMCVDPARVLDARGQVQRYKVEIGSTDLLPRMRERIKRMSASAPAPADPAATEPADAPADSVAQPEALADEATRSRLADELRGQLVMADGKPAAEPQAAPKYYGIYHAAGWCGWCARSRGSRTCRR